MEPDIWSADPLAQASLVSRAIDDIDKSTEEEMDDLLGSLLCAAWGSIHAQNQ